MGCHNFIFFTHVDTYMDVLCLTLSHLSPVCDDLKFGVEVIPKEPEKYLRMR